MGQNKLADKGFWNIVKGHEQDIQKQDAHFKMDQMNVWLVADNEVLGNGIGNILNLFHTYEALTSPESPKLKSVIPIIRINPFGGNQITEDMKAEFYEKVKREMNEATQNAITKDQGFCGYENK